MTSRNYDVKDMSLAEAGKQRIEWASREMPVIRLSGRGSRREAAQRYPHRRLPAYHHGDRQPGADPESGRSRPRSLRLQSAQHPG